MHLSLLFAFIQHHHQHRSIGACSEAGVRELRLREHANLVLIQRSPSFSVDQVQLTMSAGPWVDFDKFAEKVRPRCAPNIAK